MKLVATHIVSLTGLHLPPRLALFLTLAFIVFLFRRGVRERPNVTGALWLPLVWMPLIGSLSVVQWVLTLGVMRAGSAEEGNPLDALIYLSLIVAGKSGLSHCRRSLAGLKIPGYGLFLRFVPLHPGEEIGPGDGFGHLG